MFTTKSLSYSIHRNIFNRNFVRSLTVAQSHPKITHSSILHSTTIGTERDTSPFFITTPIYYVNGQPHLGHAYTTVVSDVIARFHRADSREVFFLTGTDEHGQKVEQSALAANKTPIEFADKVSGTFKHLAEVLGCSHDEFIRTTETRHKEAVGKLWEKLVENNQIYLGAYEGWYSIRDEAFYTEGELVDGKAPTGAAVEWVKEESYFFKLSEWTDKLLAFYEENPDFIGPKGRRNEVISFVAQEGGLRDLSVSRTTFSWGVPVPGNPKHVIYVWLDALANYISALDYPNTENERFQKFWPASLHVVGKDILRFHTVFWPAFLMAAGLQPPKRVYAHGWWTKDGEKMSKSVGNVLDPFLLLEQYGLDYVRYFMVAEILFGNDGDFTHSSFINKINSELANDVGNLAQRALTFIDKNCDGIIPAPDVFTSEDLLLLKTAEDTLDIIREQIDQQNLKGMCESIVNVSKLGNKYIDTQAPWTLRKTDTVRMRTVLYVLVETLRMTAIMLSPVMPTSCGNMLDQLGCPEDLRSFETIGAGHRMPPGTKIRTPTPIFPKIDNTKNSDSSSSSSIGSNSSGGNKDEKVNKKKNTKNSISDNNAISIESILDNSMENDSNSIEEIGIRIDQKGNEIRELKKNKVDKSAIQKSVDELLDLKKKYLVLNNGIAYGLPK